MSYLRPVRFIYRGDREKAPRYTREARRMIAALINRSGGVVSNRAHNTLPDGTTIEVIVAGNDVTAVITTEGGGRKTRWFEDFVAFTGANAFIDDELYFFPVILKHAPDTDNNWIPYFWKQSAPGYDAAPTPKGTYFDVFPRALETNRQGANLPGFEIPHINSEGRAVSWRGQAHRRYFWEPFRQPYYMYWAGVANFGRTLLNTSVYEQVHQTSLPAPYVVGAALRDNYLYVMLGDHIYGITYNDPPAPTGRRQAWMSPVYPQFPLTYALVRFPLVTRRNERTGVLEYHISSSAPHEVLWQGSLPRAINGWVFDRDVTRVVTYTVPTENRLVYIEGVPTTALSATHERHEITIAEDGTASFSTRTETTAIAEDDGAVFHLEHIGGGNWQYRLDDLTYNALSWDGGGDWSTRSILYMDLQTRCFVFSAHSNVVAGNTLFSQRQIILSIDGDETVLRTDSNSSSVRGDLMGERASVLSAAFSAPISGMAMLFNRVHGYIIDDVEEDEDGNVIADNSVYEIVYDILGNQPPALNPGASFGGGKITTAHNDEHPDWGRWDVVRGFDGSNNPGPSTVPPPDVYYTTTGGLALPDPFRVCLGITVNAAHPYQGSQVRINYITGGSLQTLTGGVVNNITTAISVSILGKPPPGQTVEY